MQDMIIETAISVFIQELIKESSNLFGRTSDEAKQFYNVGLRKYFSKQKDKYSYVKTLLQGNIPVHLYDIYFPLSVIKNSKQISTNQVSNLFEDTNFITIIGRAGSGKSTLIKHLFLNSIAEKYRIPILIELRYLNEYEDTIEQYIADIILENEVSQNLNILKRLLKRGKFVFFLDGFDEVVGKKRESLIKGFSSFINRYDKNYFILTSRPYTNIDFLPLFHNCHIQPLKDDAIEKFINLQLKREPELAKRIIESVENNHKKHIASFLSNPLLLTLYILTFQSNSDIPDKKYIFYRRVIQALFSEHDSKSKLGFVRELKSRLSQEKFEEILERFSFLTFFEQKYDFEVDYVLSKLELVKEKLPDEDFNSQFLIDDLKLAVALWVEEGNKLKFAHKSLQEYFAAYFIKDLKEDQKMIVYSKIINGLNSLNEIDNLLSLCNEMDEVAYLKHFLLPSINAVVTNLTIENEDELIEQIVTQEFSVLVGSQSNFAYHDWTKYPFRNIGEIEEIVGELYKFISEKMDEVTYDNRLAVMWYVGHEDVGAGPEDIWYANLNPFPEQLLILLKDKGIIELIDKTNFELKNLQRQKIMLVERSEKANNDLVAMI